MRWMGATRGDLLRLFEGESVAGLGDGALLERFAHRKDEAAFEALVGRHGPAVLGACRRILVDPNDVDDAFQATFLVLVRRAGSIREGGRLGPWLHGVATRVALRARAQAARRSSRERLGGLALSAEPSIEDDRDGVDLRPLIDEELERLPDHQRRPVVLCDVEGLSREEAAEQLGWTANMLRGRLARGRERLRERLRRRGLAPSGSCAAWLASPRAVPPALALATVRVSLSFAIGGGMSTPAAALARGALKMMLLSKLRLAATAALSAGLLAGGAGMLAAQGPGEPVRPSPGTAPAAPPPPRAEAIEALAKSRVEMARRRFDTQRKSFDEGRITVDRLLDASRQLAEAKGDADPAGRVAALRAHLGRVAAIEARAQAELKAGRATDADVEEIQIQRLEAEYRLALEAGSEPPLPKLGRSPFDLDEAGPARSPFDLDEAGPAPGGGAGLPKAGAARARSPLADAVAAYNSGPLAGLTRDPLTEDEVVAAIRTWSPPQDSPPTGDAVAAFRRIAETRRLPQGAAFEHLDLSDRGDFIYHGLWIRLRLNNGETGTYAFPIRTRLDRSETLEEAVAETEAALKSDRPFPGRDFAREYIDLLKERIAARGRPASP